MHLLLRLIAGLLLCLCVVRSVAAQQDSSPQATSEIPLTQSEERGIVDQIVRNWNPGSLAEYPDRAGLIVELRVELEPDGRVSKVEVLNDQPDSPAFRQAAETARRAVMISSPLKLPPGKSYSMMRFRFDPSWMTE